jgi:hypothetical protein
MCCYRATKCQVLAKFLYFIKFFRAKLFESEMPHIFLMVPAEALYLSKFSFMNLKVTSHKHSQGTVLCCSSDTPIERIM